MTIDLQHAPFDPWEALRSHQAGQTSLAAKYGATASFVGSLRDFNDDASVNGMFLEHYPGMTEKQLQIIARETAERWPVLDSLIVHRVGQIQLGEAIVLVAVWTSHRGDAFDACRYLMEALKNRAPFWKKESLAQGQRWVECNSNGYADPASNNALV
ncbi:MAG: molybdenum cofactor biosynthesis protein MoaE [Methylococcaceae bacterium]|nr:MAG: molybdenum cofactor biosynthesis protein MoaE [Methylococcaceae bacterium]